MTVIHVVKQQHLNFFSSIVNHRILPHGFYSEINNCHSENPLEIPEANQPFTLAYKLTSRLNSSVKLVSMRL